MRARFGPLWVFVHSGCLNTFKRQPRAYYLPPDAVGGRLWGLMTPWFHAGIGYRP